MPLCRARHHVALRKAYLSHDSRSSDDCGLYIDRSVFHAKETEGSGHIPERWKGVAFGLVAPIPVETAERSRR